MNKSKILSILGSALLLVLCLFVGFNVSLGGQVVSAEASTEQTISLDGVQMRGWTDGWYQYLVLQSGSYNGLGSVESIANVNAVSRDKIKLYTSESDSGKALSEINVQHLDQNFGNWTDGLFINFSEYDSALGGHQVYKVVIEAGCKLPYKNGDATGTFVVDKTYVFYNNSYGNADNKLSAMNWKKVTYQTVSLDGVQMRGFKESNAWFHYFVVNSSSFAGMSTIEDAIEMTTYQTTLDKISLYTVSDNALTENKLSDLGVNHSERNKWGAQGMFFGLDKFAQGYDGSTVYKVTVQSGCEIVVDKTDNTQTVFVVDKDYTFYNSSYGNASSAYGALEWTTQPTMAYGTTERAISLDGVQLRGIPGNQYYNYMVLLSSAYNTLSEQEKVLSGKTYCDFSGITLYTVKDGELVAKNFNEFNTEYVGRNKWGANGGFIQFNEYAEGYDGSKVYKVTISAGTKIVSEVGEKATVFVVDKDYTFYNSSYGNESSAYGALTWTTQPTMAYGTTEQTISLDGVQLRGMEGNSYYNYMVLLSSAYNTLSEQEKVISGKTYCDFSGITLYTVKDGELVAKNFNEFNTQYVGRNIWGANGGFIQFYEYAEGYDGSKVYKVTISAGTKIVSEVGEKATVFVVDKDYTFFNVSCGEADKAYGAYEWLDYEPTTTEIALSGVQMRGWKDNDWYQYLVLKSTGYTDLPSNDNIAYSSRLFSANKVKIYTSADEYKLLSELTVKHVDQNFLNWANGAFICYKGYSSGYAGNNVYKVVIEKGTRIPYSVDGKLAFFVVDKDYVYYNMSYGNEANAYSSMDWVIKEPTRETLSLSGIQIRALDETNTWYQYLVLRSDLFVKQSKVESDVKPGLSFDKVKLYLSKDDSGKTLQELGVTHIDRNLWDTGAFINFGNFSEYNGSSVYKVVIEEGFEIPVYNKTADGATATVYVVDKDYSFYNVNYGNDGAKLGSFEWWTTPVPESVENTGDIKIVNVTNQSDGVTRWLILWVNDSFAGSTSVSFYETKRFINVLDNVYLYSGTDLSVAPVKLRDVFTGSITVGQFGSPEAIGFTIRNDVELNGTNNYLVLVKGGCEMPYVKDGVFSKRVVAEDTLFMNNDYGKEGEIPGSTGSDSRLYANFAIDWSKAVFVNYETNGIEGLTFPTACYKIGEKIDFSSFNADGYNLSVTDDAGYTYYGVIYVPEKSVTMQLNYTKIVEKRRTGCQSGAFNGEEIAVMLAAVSAVIGFKKKFR